ncbi:hypothetical protein [Enterococcus caccae]|uniref:Uncharacterized protein n=1 Tax=Enterococcus caccae ATCC BAA-1240 TaxID=1158612 RepID=R3U7L4_9ENTE|nr:hypothetical protein [Enterococcus caccae]EOL49413.1 hypothetical protein UC7_00791 [Enterococcus caccae ATCC BAA-1240]EOT56465.1 hypothetical protein I580_03266 [Enterococcus caccae ATCC BAA-1240]OJG25231.1 hypothetical protein RU98_GL001056 [Enterococcus caccae]
MPEYNVKVISTPYSSELYFYQTPVIYGFTGKRKTGSIIPLKEKNKESEEE